MTWSQLQGLGRLANMVAPLRLRVDKAVAASERSGKAVAASVLEPVVVPKAH